MVFTDVTRQAIEVLFSSGKIVSLNRLDGEVLADPDDGSGFTDVTRQAVEVLESIGSVVALNRLDGEVLCSDTDGTGFTDVTRQAVEVLWTPPPRVQLNRLDAEVLVSPTAGTGFTDVVRQSIEILFPRDIASPVPLALPANYEFFTHDWSTPVTLDAAYLTDITVSPIVGAEERRGLRQKPARTLNLRWWQLDKAIVDRLIVNIKRLTNTRVPFPLYCDESVGTADSASGQTTVWCDTRYRRFFVGARVLIAPFDPDNFVDSTRLSTGIIHSIADDHLVLLANLSNSFTADQFSVFPLIDCEIVLAPKITFDAYELGAVDLSVNEYLGANTLPPTRSGVPSDMPLLDGHPVLDINLEQDFTSGVVVQYARAGDTFTRGRGPVVDPNDTKWQLVTDWKLLAETRAKAWKIIEFFDWARGRQRTFWQMDEEALWTVVALSSNFVSIDPLGTLADFEDDFGYVGIETFDGTIYARKVNTIQLISGVWKLTTTGDAWPSLSLTDIRRVARVRLSRLESDSITENWENLEVCRFSFTTIEALAEGEETT